MFCKLSDAIITDLVFDSSCTFQGKGDYVGALSAEADGKQIAITNMHNFT